MSGGWGDDMATEVTPTAANGTDIGPRADSPWLYVYVRPAGRPRVCPFLYSRVMVCCLLRSVFPFLPSRPSFANTQSLRNHGRAVVQLGRKHAIGTRLASSSHCGGSTNATHLTSATWRCTSRKTGATSLAKMPCRWLRYVRVYARVYACVVCV